MSRQKTECALPPSPKASEIHRGYLDQLDSKALGRLALVHPTLTQHYLGLFPRSTKKTTPRKALKIAQPNTQQRQQIQAFLDTYVHEESVASHMQNVLEEMCFELNMGNNSDRMERLVRESISRENVDYFYHSLPLIRDWILSSSPKSNLRTLRFKSVHRALACHIERLRPQYKSYLDTLCALHSTNQTQEKPMSTRDFVQHMQSAYKNHDLALIFYLAQQSPSSSPFFKTIMPLLDLVEKNRTKRRFTPYLDALAQCVHAIPLEERLALLEQHILQPSHASLWVIAAVLRNPSARASILDKQLHCFNHPHQMMMSLITLGKTCYNHQLKISPKKQEALQGILVVMDKVLRIALTPLIKHQASQYLYYLKKNTMCDFDERFLMMRILIEAFDQTLMFFPNEEKDGCRHDYNKLFFYTLIEAIRSNRGPMITKKVDDYANKMEGMWGICMFRKAFKQYFAGIQPVTANNTHPPSPHL